MVRNMRTLLLGLMLWGSAGAVTLYTVTVKTKPFTQNSVFSVFPEPSKSNAPALQVKTGGAAVFKLPAGKYSVTVYQPEPLLQQFGPDSIEFAVRKNLSINLPVTMFPVMDTTGRSVFNRLLIAMTGSTTACAHATVSDICAAVDSSYRVVLGYIGLQDAMIQTDPWSAYSNIHSAHFQIGVNSYYISVQTEGDGYSSFIVFSRE